MNYIIGTTQFLLAQILMIPANDFPGSFGLKLSSFGLWTWHRGHLTVFGLDKHSKHQTAHIFAPGHQWSRQTCALLEPSKWRITGFQTFYGHNSKHFSPTCGNHYNHGYYLVVTPTAHTSAVLACKYVSLRCWVAAGSKSSRSSKTMFDRPGK